jgi:hypothetical protein
MKIIKLAKWSAAVILALVLVLTAALAYLGVFSTVKVSEREMGALFYAIS